MSEMDVETKNIGEWFSINPCEAWHSTYPIGTKEWSEQITRHRYFVQPHIRKFAEFDYSQASGLPWWSGKKILEIGCGIGTDTLEFAKVGAQIDALDFSFSSISIAGDRFRAAAIPYGDEWAGNKRDVRFFWSNAENFMPEGSYDLVFSFGVLHHTPHPEKVLALAHNRLKDDGELRIMLYAKWSLKHLLGRQPEAAPGCPLVRWYSFRDVKKLLSSCGFKVLRIEKTHIFPWRIKYYRDHRFVKAFPWNICPLWLFRWLEHYLGHHLLITAVRQ
jgi:SAM-dependent methyltransferase